MSSYLSLTQLETLPVRRVFTVSSPRNPQNDRLYVPAGTRRSRSLLSVCCVREQRSVGRWWCRSVSQSLASQIWFLLAQGCRLMVPIIGMFCCHRNCCPWCVRCRESSLSFSRTAHPHTEPAILSDFWSRQISAVMYVAAWNYIHSSVVGFWLLKHLSVNKHVPVVQKRKQKAKQSIHHYPKYIRKLCKEKPIAWKRWKITNLECDKCIYKSVAVKCSSAISKYHAAKDS